MDKKDTRRTRMSCFHQQSDHFGSASSKKKEAGDKVSLRDIYYVENGNCNDTSSSQHSQVVEPLEQIYLLLNSSFHTKHKSKGSRSSIRVVVGSSFCHTVVCEICLEWLLVTPASGRVHGTPHSYHSTSTLQWTSQSYPIQTL